MRPVLLFFLSFVLCISDALQARDDDFHQAISLGEPDFDTEPDPYWAEDDDFHQAISLGEPDFDTEPGPYWAEGQRSTTEQNTDYDDHLRASVEPMLTAELIPGGSPTEQHNSSGVGDSGYSEFVPKKEGNISPDTRDILIEEPFIPNRDNQYLIENSISPHSLPGLKSLSNTTVWYLRSPLSTRVIPVIYLLVAAVGIPANIAILCLLATKVRKVCSAIFYCSLAVSDLLLLFALIFKAHYHLHGNHWVLGEAACRVVTACFYGNLYCSAMTLACISIMCYLAVVHPFVYKNLPKRTCTGWVSVAVWGVFGAAVVPDLIIQQSYWLPEVNLVTCHDVLPLYHDTHIFLLYYNLVLTLFVLVVPLVVTVVCFARVICELKRSHHDWAMYIKASSLVFGIFLVCFVPAGVLHFFHYVQLYVDQTEISYVFFNMAVCLCCLHACLDPFLFLLMSKSTSSKTKVCYKAVTTKTSNPSV